MRRALALCASAAMGCSLQLSGGTTPASKQGAFPVAFTAAAYSSTVRRDSAVLGARATAVSRSADQPLLVRNAAVSAGYFGHTRRCRFGFESGFELGLGEPTFGRTFDGAGLYVGGAGAVRYRIVGTSDLESSFHIVATYAEIVAGWRAGAWIGPETTRDTNTYGEVAFDLGLRVGFLSDAIGSKPQAEAR